MMILLGLALIFFVWLIFTAFTLEDPALTMHQDEDEDAESAVAEAAARVRDDLLQSVEDRVVDVEDRVLRELQVRCAPAVCTACALAADHFRA